MKQLQLKSFIRILVLILVLSYKSDNAGVIRQIKGDITISQTGAQIITGWGGCPDQSCINSDVPFVYACGNIDVPLVYDAVYNELGATICRMRLWPNCGSDNQGNINPGNDTTGLNRVYYLLNEARKRGVTNWYTSIWHAPPAMCLSGTEQLDPQYDSQYCIWIANCINYLVNTKGVTLPTGICAFNEPSNTHMFIPNNQLVRVTKLLKTTLQNYPVSNIRDIPIITNDNDTYHNFDVSSDTSYWNSAQIFSCHSYYWGINSNCNPGDPDIFIDACNRYGADKPRWMTENCPNVHEGHTPWMNQPNQLGHAISMTQQLACDFGYAGFNMWSWWTFYNPMYGPEGDIDADNSCVLLEGDGKTALFRSKTFYVLKKIWNEAKVGSVVHKITCTDPDFKTGHEFFADGVAFVYNRKTILVLTNDDSSASKFYNIKGLTGSLANIYRTTANQDMELVGTLAVSEGEIPGLKLPPLSITVLITLLE